MVKNTNNVIDALGQTHAIFKEKIEAYKESRPPFRFLSARNQFNIFIKDEKVFRESIEEAYDQIAATSAAASKSAGLHVLLIVRDALLAYGQDMRQNGKAKRIQHRFLNLRHPNEIPIANLYYRRKAKKQKVFQQSLAADMEAQSLIIFMEKRLVKSGHIIEAEKIPMTNDVFKLNTKAEDALDDLRMIVLA